MRSDGSRDLTYFFRIARPGTALAIDRLGEGAADACAAASFVFVMAVGGRATATFPGPPPAPAPGPLMIAEKKRAEKMSTRSKRRGFVERWVAPDARCGNICKKYGGHVKIRGRPRISRRDRTVLRASDASPNGESVLSSAMEDVERAKIPGETRREARFRSAVDVVQGRGGGAI